MKRSNIFLIVAALLLLSLALIQPVKAGLQTQQAQIGVTIIVNVAPPTPVAYAPREAPAATGSGEIAAKMSLQRAVPSLNRVFEAQSLHFNQTSSLVVAQAQVQKPLLVQAEVSPNPNATLLYSNNPTVTINATAGTTVQVPCAFTVTVSTTTSWSLDQGLSNDFATNFSGKDLGNNTYVSTPKPTSTPYYVYADNGNEWTLAGTGSAITTYCVTLTLTVPSTVSAGTYSSNAIYTLFVS